MHPRVVFLHSLSLSPVSVVDVCELIRRLTGHGKCEVDVRLRGCPQWLLVDPNILLLCLEEALSNADKYGMPGTAHVVTIELKEAAAAEPVPEEEAKARSGEGKPGAAEARAGEALTGSSLAHISIDSSNATGLPLMNQEECEAIFPEGSKGSSTVHRPSSQFSNGLGLDSVRRACRAARGSAYVRAYRDSAGQGHTVLHLRLPASRVGAPLSEAREPPSPSQAGAGISSTGACAASLKAHRALGAGVQVPSGARAAANGGVASAKTGGGVSSAREARGGAAAEAAAAEAAAAAADTEAAFGARQSIGWAAAMPTKLATPEGERPKAGGAVPAPLEQAGRAAAMPAAERSDPTPRPSATRPTRLPPLCYALDDCPFMREYHLSVFARLGADPASACLGQAYDEIDEVMRRAMGEPWGEGANGHGDGHADTNGQHSEVPRIGRHADLLVLDEHLHYHQKKVRGSALARELRARGYAGAICIFSGESLDFIAELRSRPSIDIVVTKGSLSSLAFSQQLERLLSLYRAPRAERRASKELLEANGAWVAAGGVSVAATAAGLAEPPGPEPEGAVVAPAPRLDTAALAPLVDLLPLEGLSPMTLQVSVPTNALQCPQMPSRDHP